MPKREKTIESTDIRSRVLSNASKTGKDAYPITTMGFALVMACLS